MKFDISDWGRQLSRLIGGMEREHWMIAFAVVVIIGIFCMRGFGSRANY